MTQSFAEKPELVRWALMHGTRQRQRHTKDGDRHASGATWAK
jgi:hypothetical protein